VAGLVSCERLDSATSSNTGQAGPTLIEPDVVLYFPNQLTDHTLSTINTLLLPHTHSVNVNGHWNHKCANTHHNDRLRPKHKQD